ncbi:MAG: InlB B-repeat-containing protein [Acholeplasmataceae bacterium]|jgi:uncharacterized repeat protein (TIGR02543 family)|nr:InlB B-repeat-containing protein [Acholeplasmataceae bacterium]
MNKMIKLLTAVLFLFAMQACSKVDKDMTLTIEFDSQGGNDLDSITINKTEYDGIFEEPFKEGYEFISWNLDLEGEVFDYDFSQINTKTITLYATWEQQSYQLIFMDEDETILYQESVLYDDLLEDSYQDAPLKIGYTFNGWDIDLPNKMPAHDVIAKATYLVNSYTISFETNGAFEIVNLNREYNTPFSVEEPSLNGYTFIGWFLDADFETAFTDFIVPAFDITLYAKWDIITYHIFYDLDGGTNGDNPDTYTIASDTITLVDPVKEGYTFEGWLEGSQIVSGSTGDQTFAATYTINQYTLTFDSYGGTEVSSITQDYGLEVIAPEEPMKEGYTFGGWYITESHDETYNFPNISRQDITLYAKWDIITYHIFYDLDGGTNGDNPDTYTVASATITLVDPVKEGYTFEGWLEGSQIVSGSTGDQTFTATWMIEAITLSYYVYDNYHDNALLLNIDEEIIQVELGDSHSAVLTSFGRVFVWGENTNGEIGDGTTIDRFAPVDITPFFNLHSGEKIISISLGWGSSIALSSENRVFTWGANFVGQIGDGTTISKSTPVDITAYFNLHSGEKITQIDLGYAYCIAVSSESRVFTWGYNNSGQIGDNTVIDKYTPTDITSRFNLNTDEVIIELSAGQDHVLVYTSHHRIFGWGNNMYGALGDNTSISKFVPTDLTINFGFAEGETVIKLSSNEYYSSLITSAHRVFTWGVNDFGQLGDGTNIFRYSPVDITAQFNLHQDETVIDMVTGKRIVIVVTSENRVFMWGNNNAYQLGDGSTSNMSTPFEITSRFDLDEDEVVTLVHSGGNHSLAVTSKNRVFTWGWNGYGQLGFGLNPERTGLPTLVFLYPPILVNYIVYDPNVGLTEYNIEKIGYTFFGWFTDQEMTIPYIFSSSIDERLVLYGYWVKNI